MVSKFLWASFLLLLPLSSLAKNKNISPKIENGTLYIHGPIDSHIYDYISYSYKEMKDVHTVDLHSLGGNSNWAMEIGRRIQELELNTQVTQGHYCASACIYLLGSGSKRTIHESVWLGVHGARLGAGVFSSIASSCYQETQKVSTQNNSTQCQKELLKWYKIAKETTDKSFKLIEAAGVSTQLKTFYYSLDEEDQWFENGNILRVKDLVLSASLAKDFNLATDIEFTENSFAENDTSDDFQMN